MKREKGFTLVELMGILVILGIILIVTVPTITKTLKGSKANEEAEFLNTVCAAAKTYLSINKESTSPVNVKSFWVESTSIKSITINITLLKDEGYLADNLNNPTTKTQIIVKRAGTSSSDSGTISCSW